jgi:hypothetical protein
MNDADIMPRDIGSPSAGGKACLGPARAPDLAAPEAEPEPAPIEEPELDEPDPWDPAVA